MKIKTCVFAAAVAVLGGGLPFAAEPTAIITLLSAEKKDFPLGGPIPFQISVKNMSSQQQSYDPYAKTYATGNDPLEVLDSSGVPQPFIGNWSAEHKALDAELPYLAPGKTQKVIDADLSELYLITRPGVYKIRYKKSALLPQSLPLKFSVQMGIPPPADLATEKLIALFPAPGWLVTRYTVRVDQNPVSPPLIYWEIKDSPEAPKKHITVSCRAQKGEPPLDYINSKTNQTKNYLGRGGLGYFYWGASEQMMKDNKKLQEDLKKVFLP
jgi:hypothetical protein